MALNQRERWIHYFSLLSIFGILEHIPKAIIYNLGKKIRDERCRKLTDKDLNKILEELGEEQRAGQIVLGEILDKLLTEEKCERIDRERPKRNGKPFDIFFLKDERDSRDDFV